MSKKSPGPRRGAFEFKVVGPGTPAFRRDIHGAVDLAKQLARANIARGNGLDEAFITETATGRVWKVTQETDSVDIAAQI
jgi:hypothetical protein